MDNQKWELCPLCGSYMIFKELKVDDKHGFSFTVKPVNDHWLCLYCGNSMVQYELDRLNSLPTGERPDPYTYRKLNNEKYNG